MVPASPRPRDWNHAEEEWIGLESKDVSMTLTTALQRVKGTPQSSYGHLCAPFEAAELPAASVATMLAEWRFFNPFGPSRSALFAAAVPDSPERLLIQRIPPPQRSTARVWGWLPSSEPNEMRPVVAALFQANGSADMPLMSTLPTHVELQAGFPPEDLKEFFWLAAQATNTCNLKRTCDYLEWFKDNPFERAAVELRDALDGKRSAARATRAEFERWWGLVTDSRHVAIENLAIEEALKAHPGELANFLREALRSRPEVF